MKALVLAVVLAGCVDAPSAPRVHIVVPAGADELQTYVDATNAWSTLGFVASFDDSGLPECERGTATAWHRTGVIDCQISIGILRVPNLVERSGGAAGLTDGSTVPATVEIDARFDGFALLSIAAHEAGHVLLDTAHHAPAGVDAIMAPTTAEWFAQPADYTLACASIALGCDR